VKNSSQKILSATDGHLLANHRLTVSQLPTDSRPANGQKVVAGTNGLFAVSTISVLGQFLVYLTL